MKIDKQNDDENCGRKCCIRHWKKKKDTKEIKSSNKMKKKWTYMIIKSINIRSVNINHF